MTEKRQKVAIVTGASRGIGAAIAKRLAKEGLAVVINYANSSSEASTLVAEVVAAGGRAIAVQADVANPESVKQLFETTETMLGRVDILINNAGILVTTTIAEATDSQFEQLFDINVKGTFNTLREAASRMNEGGKIINLSTSALAMSMPGYGLYNATKAAIEALTKVFAKELRGRKITVNAVAPGPIATNLFFQGKSEEVIEYYRQLSPLERLGDAEDVASFVAVLVCSDADWVNGQTIRVNGGIA